jgi:hypothetical protein
MPHPFDNVFPQAQADGWQKSRGDKPGMNLRTYLAGHILQGLAANRKANEYRAEQLAERSVELADALIERLNARS